MTRTCLALITVCVVLQTLRAFIAPTPAHAQKKAAPPPRPQYVVVLADDKGNLNLESGTARLTLQGLINALDQFPKAGWKIFSVVPSVSGSPAMTSGSFTSTGYVVVLTR